MMRRPPLEWWFEDFEADTRCLSVKAVGGWVRILNALDAARLRGQDTLDIEGWAAIIGADKVTSESILQEIKRRKVARVTFCNANVTGCNGLVTVVNRRMERERKERQALKLRVRRHRLKRRGNGPVRDCTDPRARAVSTYPTDPTDPTDQQIKKKEQPEVPPELNNATFAEAWNRWLTHRREIRHPLTASTVKAQLGKLAAVGSDAAVKMIEQSIQNGWQGLFPVKEHTRGRAAGGGRGVEEIPYAGANETIGTEL